MFHDVDAILADTDFAIEWDNHQGRLSREYDAMQAGMDIPFQPYHATSMWQYDAPAPVDDVVVSPEGKDEDGMRVGMECAQADDKASIQDLGTPATYAGVVDAPIESSVPAAAVGTTRNAYGSREARLAEELLRQRDAGNVELGFGEFGVRGENVCVSRVVFKEGKHEVFEGLNKSISAPCNTGVGVLAENVTQCLRDCGVVPRKSPGRENYSWKAPADSTWEFSWVAFKYREKRLAEQHGKKRKEREESGRGGVAHARGGALAAAVRPSKLARRVAAEEVDHGRLAGGSHSWPAASGNTDGGAEAGEEVAEEDAHEPSSSESFLADQRE